MLRTARSLWHSDDSSRDALVQHRIGSNDFSDMLPYEESHDIEYRSSRPPREDPPDYQKSLPLPPSALEEAHKDAGDVTFAKPQDGLWKRQMLVDRSLRGMALTMSLFALGMVILCATSYSQTFKPLTAGSASCDSVASSSQVIHLFINVAATMILGMSNTYQQLVTSLNTEDIKWALSKAGDARVGTNSPFSIKYQRHGRWRSYLAWLLLIVTSLPVHLLANSVIGPTYEISPMPVTAYRLLMNNTQYEELDNSQPCLTALLSGYYPVIYSEDSTVYSLPSLYNDITVYYNETACGSQINTTGFASAQAQAWDSPDSPLCGRSGSYGCDYAEANEPLCGINVRLEAALTLAGCLLFKALYMLFVNFKERTKNKTQCLTFGDVVVAAVIDPGLQVQNESMVNAGEFYRHEVKHICHHHCKNKEPSVSGDELGHCQKCKKLNTTNKAAHLPCPVLSTKYKKSLLSNLGSASLVQMIILMLCSTAMLACSLVLAVILATKWQGFQSACRDHENMYDAWCSQSLSTFISTSYGGFGGFNQSVPVTSLPPDSGSSEMISFWIANGAQLIFSLLYLLLIYNITLISMEYDWGQLEKNPQKLRCTLVQGPKFQQSYLVQLRKRIMLVAMIVSALMHWLLGQSISTIETIWQDFPDDSKHSMYTVVYAVYPVWLATFLMLAMTSLCWWAFTYTREGFIPQMYGSIRVCCAATTELCDFGNGFLKWGDVGAGDKFRRAGLSSGPVDPIVPAELYA